MTDLRYLRSFSGTVLCLIKVGFACFILYYMINFLVELQPVIAQIQKTGGTIAEGMAAYLKLLMDSLKIQHLGPSVQALLKANLGIVYSLLVMFCTIFLTPVLILLEGIGAASLRFTKRGGSLIRFSRHVNAALSLITVADYSILLVLCFSNMVLIGMANLVVFGVALGLGIILSGMSFFYHRDIIKTMSLVKKNLNEGPVPMKKTHLSGVSFLAALGWAFMLISLFVMSPMTSNVLLGMIYAGLMLLKQLFVCLSYRGVKKYNPTA